MGGRVFLRPLLGTGIPIIKDAEIGFTGVVDRDPYAYDSTPGTSGPVFVYGADIVVPIIKNRVFPLAAFTDVAFEPNNSMGTMLGAGGRLFSFFTYTAQIRLLQEGFIPDYFDANYDTWRSAKADYMESSSGGDFYTGWYASLGFSLFHDKLAFQTRLDGPFAAKPVAPTNVQTDYPHLKAVLSLSPNLLKGLFFDASYEKYYLGMNGAFFDDLVDPTDSIVGLDINYQTGASVLTLAYNAKWDPTLGGGAGDWVVTSSISVSMKF
jgi:hypothetical protein